MEQLTQEGMEEQLDTDMEFGIGIDIIEIDRIKKSVDRFGDRFLNKVFTEKEIEYCLSKANKYQHLAARFAAKEAIYKALAGISEEITWKSIEIMNEPNGLPIVKTNGKLKDKILNNKEIKLSMSHSDNYVTCVAIVYNKK